MKIHLKLATCLLLLFFVSSASAQEGKIKHVVLIGCDGLGAYAIPNAAMPNLKRIMREGAYSLHARSVLPSSSAVNWASMLMGAGPTFHGFTEWGSKTPEISPVDTTQYGLFPSIFSVIREQQPQARTAAIYSWEGIGYLIERQAIDFVEPAEDDDDRAVEQAVRLIQQEKPTFTFIHLDQPDGVGHAIGHRTLQYFAELKNVDARIGKIEQAILDAGIAEETLLIITADHGGIGKGHGGKTLEEVEIPWVIKGPGVQENKALKQSIITYDTGATIAWALGLTLPEQWRGKPVKEAFDQ